MGGLRSSTGALVLHPGLIFVTNGVSPVTSRLPETGFPPWSILPSLATCALGTCPHPGAGQGACGRAGGYFTGYFTCWHQLFPPSAPNHVPPPRATHPASCHPTTGHCYGGGTLCSPLSPLCHSQLSVWPNGGATCIGFLLLGHWWGWERGCCTQGQLLKLGVRWPWGRTTRVCSWVWAQCLGGGGRRWTAAVLAGGALPGQQCTSFLQRVLLPCHAQGPCPAPRAWQHPQPAATHSSAQRRADGRTHDMDPNHPSLRAPCSAAAGGAVSSSPLSREHPDLAAPSASLVWAQQEAQRWLLPWAAPGASTGPSRSQERGQPLRCPYAPGHSSPVCHLL